MSEQDRLKNRLRNLPQYKSLTEEELDLKIKEKLEQNEIMEGLTFCINDTEKSFAKNLLENYLTQRSFEDFSEKQTLGQLIDQEILAKRIKEDLKKEYTKANPTIPLQLVEQLDSVIERIQELKEQLGLIRKENQENSAIQLYEEAKKKALIYYEEHKGCNTVKCPYCQSLFNLLFDRTDYKEVKAIWFKGTHVYNKSLFALYHNKILNEEQVASVLGVSKFDIDLLYNGIFLKELNDSQNK